MHPYSGLIRDATASLETDIMVERFDIPEPDIEQLYTAHPGLVERLNREIQRVDIGIDGLEVRQGNGGSVLVFRHRGHEHPMRLHYQSHRTRQFMKDRKCKRLNARHTCASRMHAHP